MLSLSFVTGTEPGKWFARFRERTRHGGISTLDSDDPLAMLLDARVDLALARLPDERIGEDFHIVELYEEAPGVALPKDSELTLLKVLTPRDIDGEIINYRAPAKGIDIQAVRDGLQVVAANVGVLIGPRPLLKVLSHKQIEHRDFRDPSQPVTQIALVWAKDKDSEAIQDFVGIAKGRTANSSRLVAPKRSAREKTLAKQARRAQLKPKPKPKSKQRRR